MAARKTSFCGINRGQFTDLCDERLNIPSLGPLGVLQEVVRGAVAGGLAAGGGLGRGLPDDEEEKADPDKSSDSQEDEEFYEQLSDHE